MPTEMENATIYQSAQNIPTPVYGSSLAIDASAITVTSSIQNPFESIIDDKMKEYCYSTDKHLDDLEEDIDFLDKKRKEMNDYLAFHHDKIGEFEKEIHLLKDENEQLHKYLTDLQSQIYTLQERLDNQ